MWTGNSFQTEYSCQNMGYMEMISGQWTALKSCKYKEVHKCKEFNSTFEYIYNIMQIHIHIYIMSEFVRTREDVCERYSREENKIFDNSPLPLMPLNPYLLVVTLLPIHSLLFIDSYKFVYVYTYLLLNITYSFHLMLLVCFSGLMYFPLNFFNGIRFRRLRRKYLEN